MNFFNLEKFEYLCYSRSHEGAARELMAILRILDNNYGALNEEFSATSLEAVKTSPEAIDLHVLTRLSAAISALFSDPDFSFSDDGFIQMIHCHRWLSTLFAASPSHNADHILRSLNKTGYELDEFCVDPKNLAKFCMLYGPESEIKLDGEALWSASPVLAANLMLALISPRFLASPAAHSKRESLLRWLPDNLDKIKSLDDLPVGILHDVYMHCSYADYPGKHDIKKPINNLIRRKLTQLGFVDVQKKIKPFSGKPVMLVVLEYFSASHSIYRTHSTTLRAARNYFHIVGIGSEGSVDAVGRSVFDEFVKLSNPGHIPTTLQQVQDLAVSISAQVMYMPSVGMFPLTMFLANLRVAPVQIMALGHPATTHSDKMDYVVVEDDYVGDPAVFSEKLLRLPKDALPYVPSASACNLDLSPIFREKQEIVKIAVCSTTMKLNPLFLEACRAIAERSSHQVEFHFLVGQAVGLLWLQVDQVIKRYLGSMVVVHSHKNYSDYIEIVRGCDLFINPFPFGNTNGIVDTVSVGLVGVCRTGIEVHEHIDEGMFGRLGLPSWMVAKTTEEYINAAVRLIDNEEERLSLRKKLVKLNSVKILFEGRPELFGKKVLEVVNEQAKLI